MMHYLKTEDLVDGLPPHELERQILEMTAQQIQDELIREVKKLLDQGLTMEDIFGEVHDEDPTSAHP